MNKRRQIYVGDTITLLSGTIVCSLFLRRGGAILHEITGRRRRSMDLAQDLVNYSSQSTPCTQQGLASEFSRS